jgi:hypothetical protein
MVNNAETFIIQEKLIGEHPSMIYDFMQVVSELRPGGYFKQTKNPNYDPHDSYADSKIEYRYYYSTKFTVRKVEYTATVSMGLSYYQSPGNFDHEMVYVNYRKIKFEGREELSHDDEYNDSINDYCLAYNSVDNDYEERSTWLKELQRTFTRYEKDLVKEAIKLYSKRDRAKDRKLKKQEAQRIMLEPLKLLLIQKHGLTASDKVDKLFTICMKSCNFKEKQIIKHFAEYVELIK